LEVFEEILFDMAAADMLVHFIFLLGGPSAHTTRVPTTLFSGSIKSNPELLLLDVPDRLLAKGKLNLFILLFK
jgi:hypothetical protein